MAKQRFYLKIVRIAAAVMLLIGMVHAVALGSDILKGGYVFEADQAVSSPNVFISQGPSNIIVFENGAVLDADIAFAAPNLEIWEKWHRETGADPNAADGYGLVPISALTAGNSGYVIVLEPGAGIINRAELSDGIMALGSVDITIGRENMTADAYVHGNFAAIFVDGLFSGGNAGEVAGREPIEASIVNYGTVGSNANKNLESRFGVWLAEGLEGDRFTIDNAGRIEGTESAVTVEGGFGDIAITNTGTIASGKLGISVGQVHPQYIWEQDPYAIKGLINFFSGQITLDNHGEITGEEFAGVGIWANGGPSVINNHETGQIRSNEVALQLVGGGEIVNKGVIEGGTTGIYIPNSTATIIHSGTLKATADDGDAILFGPSAIGGTVTLHSSVDGNIRHMGERNVNATRLNLEDAGEAVSTGDIRFGKDLDSAGGEIRQTGGTWSLGDIWVGQITVEDGEMIPGESVTAREGIDIGANGRLVISHGEVETRNLINRGIFDFSGGTVTVNGGLFDYNESPQDMVLSGPDNPNLKLVGRSEATGINTLFVGATDSGPGTLTLEGGSTVFVADSLSVVSGGTLFADGTVAGNVEALSGSRIMPGHPIPPTRQGREFSAGTLTVSGDMAIADGAVVGIKIQDKDTAGTILVENDVAIQGGIVEVESIARGSVPDGSVHTFLSAGGAMAGEFAGIISLSPIYDFELGRTGNDYFFTTARLEDYANYAQTANQRAVAVALSDARESERLEVLVSRMEILLEDILLSDGEKAPLMPSTLDQLSPEPYHAAYRMNLVHTSHMTRQMMHGARQSRMALAIDPAMFAAEHGLAGDNKAWVDPGQMGASAWNSNRRVFYGLYRRLGGVDGSPGRSGYDFKARGFYLGSERATSDNLVVGVNFGYAYTSLSFDDYRGELSTNGFRLGPHASFNKGDLSVDFAASLGWHLNRQERNIALPFLTPSTRAKFDVYDGSAYLEARYAKSVRDYFTISPMASVHFMHQKRESIKERADHDVPLKIDSDSHQSLRSFAGMGLSRQFRGGSYVIIPELFGGWGYESLDQDIDIDAAFMGAQASRFRVTAEGLDRRSIIIGGGLTALFGEYNSAFLRYEREYIDEGDINTLMAGVKWNF